MEMVQNEKVKMWINILQNCLFILVLGIIFYNYEVFKDIKKLHIDWFYNLYLFNFIINFVLCFMILLNIKKKYQNYYYLLIGINMTVSLFNLFISGYSIYGYYMVLIILGYLSFIGSIFNILICFLEETKVILILNFIFLLILLKY